jgi:putative spermidine/putrescine transport system permease protein
MNGEQGRGGVASGDPGGGATSANPIDVDAAGDGGPVNPDPFQGRGAPLSARYGRRAVTAVLAATVGFLLLPLVVTFLSSFARDATGVVPSGFVTFEHWEYVLGLGGQVEDAAQRSLQIRTPLESPVFRSTLLALGGVAINLVVGVPVAYVVSRYDFVGSDWLNTFAILPLAPGIILGIAFLQAYPVLSATNFGLIVGYSLLKLPFMVMAVQSSFESIPLRRLEESARSLGASWPRTFLTVVVPNAKPGIVAGAIICWTLAAAEFNFSYIVDPKGSQPLALFLQAHISNSSWLTQAAAVSVFFLLIAGVTALLQLVGSRGFALGGLED